MQGIHFHRKSTVLFGWYREFFIAAINVLLLVVERFMLYHMLHPCGRKSTIRSKYKLSIINGLLYIFWIGKYDPVICPVNGFKRLFETNFHPVFFSLIHQLYIKTAPGNRIDKL